ncbi:H(+)/Cl(-) exchange transporter ClcA [Zobellia galactanivorans]|uniref:H(+)/Cl(-) exchange transporter ClcA n=1 Tax=Zobellia galactanivorans (strain DSM 12802 / CCUG 47099 / CIP 106680 / NCIMB 13871 / Dsij) TaxID=63186 RepID=UPI001C06E2EF|nr:H(+)/Cl(-) exchange transporter ClcA [Zobellia galactanivorans]MBU3024523.1 H(+)/Cl(-) exchange transporter ClcA [Zobellia galactanivorans]MDO6807627.1 H(+)/Cl(-) exchange transporter ClcA [Zobellia galactanivorans]
MGNRNGTSSKDRSVNLDIRNYKLLLNALLIGVITGLLSSIFRLVLARLSTFRTTFQIGQADQLWQDWFWPMLFTFFGIWFSIFLVKKYAPEAAGSGIQEIEGALDGVRAVRWRKVLPIKFFASIFSLSSGLLLGREGPTVQIGANVGKMVEDVFKQSVEEDNPLISTGAASGLASAFNAPFSGIIFVIEEMNGHFKFNFYSLAALMIGAGSADMVVRFLVGSGPILKTTIFTFEDLSGLWLFVVFGLILSFIGIAFNKLLIEALDFFKKIRINPMVIALGIAFVITAVGLYSEDMIYSGYSTIANAYNDSFTLKFLLALFVVRFFLSIMSYGSGVPGGIFTPLITLGVISGMLFGGMAQYFFPDVVQDPAIFGVAGMAGIFASTIRAPLTGLALSVEMTANYELILPLIFTAVTASVCTTMLGNAPIYSILLKRILNKGETAV